MFGGGIFTELIIDNFCTREVSELTRVHDRLKEAVAEKQTYLAEAEQHAAALRAESIELAQAVNDYEGEIYGLKQLIDGASRNYDALKKGIALLEEDRATAAAELLQTRAKHAAELLQSEQSRKKRAAALDAEFKDRHKQLEAEFKAKINALEADLKIAKSALAEVVQQQQHAAAELASLNTSIATAQTELKQQQTELKQHKTQLKQQYESASEQHARKLEKLATAERQRIEAINDGIKIRAGRVQRLRDEYNEVLAQRIAEAEREISLRQQQFNLELQKQQLELREDNTRQIETLQFKRQQVISEVTPAIQAPLIAEIEALQIELGRMAVKVKGKEGKSSIWQAEQIKSLLTHTRNGIIGPAHLRLAGASESGKSYMLNQLINGGLKSMGVEADWMVLDPFGSDTEWAKKPDVYEDPDRAAELIREWAESSKDRSNKLPRPCILVVDEADTIIKDFGLSGHVKDLIKMGRHTNRFLYLSGQSGNCIPGLQWSDLRNLGQVYLSSVAIDFIENGRKGRDANRYLGELEALSEQSRYYAVVQEKERKPYCVLVPEKLFPTEPAAAAPPPGATAPALPAASEPAALACPKCGSTEVKRNGKHIDGRQKVKCTSCKKSSILDT